MVLGAGETYGGHEDDDTKDMNDDKGVEKPASNELEREEVQAVGGDETHEAREGYRLQEGLRAERTSNGPFVNYIVDITILCMGIVSEKRYAQ